MLLRKIARPLLAAVFVAEGVSILQNPGPLAEGLQPALGGASNTNGSAEAAARAIAAAEVASGVLLALGKAPRAAAASLAAISTVGLSAHPFWTEVDSEDKRRELGEFVNGVGRLGAILIAAADTEGKPSLGWRSRHAAEAARERSGELLDSAAEFAREKAELAREKAAALASHG